MRTLLLLALTTGVLGWGVPELSDRALLALPRYSPVTTVLIALFEAGLAKVVSDKIQGRSRGRRMHPLQVARALVLAKASSAAGALLLGLYGGMFVWTFPQREGHPAVASDALVAALSAGAALLLVVGALLLERACRTPQEAE